MPGREGTCRGMHAYMLGQARMLGQYRDLRATLGAEATD